MSEAISGLARKALAVAVLLVAAWVLLRVVIGIVASVAWIIVVVVALVGIIWAWSTLSRG